MSPTLILSALLLTGCTAAPYVKQPPGRFQGDAIVAVQFASDPKVTCAAGPSVRGCVKGDVLVVAPNPCGLADWYPQLLCHELGHINGWPAGHPNP